VFKTVAAVLVAAAVLTSAGLAFADTVYLANGGKLEGQIIRQDTEKVVIKTKYGTQTIDRMDIDRIDRSKSPRDEYQEKKAKIKDRDAEGHYQLGLWCKESGLVKKAKAEFEEAVKINPDHEGARKALGYQKHEGEWLTEEQASEKKGFKKWQGTLVSSGEFDRLLKEKIKRDKEKEEKEAAKLAEEVRKATEAAAKEYKGVPWKDRHIFKSKEGHFNIECNSTRKIADKYAWLMDRLYEKYQKVFKAFKPDKREITIYIHRNHQEFMQMRRKPAGVGGFYIPGRHVLYAFHGMFGGTGNTTTVLAHEGTHLFQDLIRMFGRPVRSPIWLTEGMAVLMEAAEVNWRTGKIRIRGVSRDRLVALQASLKRKGGAKPMTLRQLLDTQQRRFTGLHYAYAGMLTYWLLQEATPKHAMLYNDYVKITTGWPETRTRARRIQKGDFENLLQKYLKCDLSKLEEKWKKWALKQKPEKLVQKKGNKYICKKLGFSVTRPSSKWKGDIDNVERGELVVFRNKELGARIAVRAGGNFMNHTLESYVTALKKSYSDAVSKGNITDYKVVLEKFDTVKGHKVYNFVILAKRPKSAVTKELMKYRYAYFILPDNIYSVRMMAPPDKYDQCLEGFLSTLEGFEIDL
jgi:hypothetical protein